MPRRPAQAAPHVSAERITADRRYRFNPIRDLSAARLVRRIESWEAGHIQDLARTFAAVETRDDNLVTLAPGRYDAPSRLPWDILIAEGESENPEALRQRAALLYFFNSLRATDATEQNLRGSFSLFVRQVARAIGHRYSVHETIWRPADPVWDLSDPEQPIVRAGLSAEYRFVPLWFFENTESRLRYLPVNVASQGQEMAEQDWFVAVGRGLLLASTINYVFQRMSLNDWLQFNKDFGSGFLDVATAAEKGSAEWAGLRNDIASLFRAKGLLHGTGTTVTYSGPGSGQAIFDGLLERLEKRLIRLWTGSELAVKAGPSDGVGATNQQQTSDAILEADALWLEEQLHEGVSLQVLRWWFGPEVRPLVYLKLLTPSKQNIDAELKKDAQLVKWGGQIKLSKLAEKYGTTVENGDEYAKDSVQSPQSTVKSPMSTQDPGLRTQDFANEAAAASIDAETKYAVASALAAANQPLADRLAVLDAIKDEAAFLRELQDIATDKTLAAAILDSPALQDMARAQANGMAAHMLNALTKRKVASGKGQVAGGAAKPMGDDK